MAKENKMYSSEVVDKATSAVAMGLSCDNHNFEEFIKELPEEVQVMVVASVLAGRNIIRMRMKIFLSKAFEVEKKLKEMKNPTEEDADKLFREAFGKMSEEKQ